MALLLATLGLLLATAPAAPAAENPAFRQMANQAFHTLDPRDERILLRTGARTPDDGLVVLRFFIPHHLAGGRVLKGDARGFSDDPRALSRASLTWDTRSGAMSLVVAHSCRLDSIKVGPACKDALPLRAPGREATWQGRDRKRSDNRAWVGAFADGYRARLSLLNPFTNFADMTAWSVDFDITVQRAVDNRYRLAVTGNGYPGIEMYYYPRNGTRRSFTQALRKVQPDMRSRARSLVDPGGGLGARDTVSWNTCTQPSAFRMDCRAQQKGEDWVTTWR